jgi:hypothetical protein
MREFKSLLSDEQVAAIKAKFPDPVPVVGLEKPKNPNLHVFEPGNQEGVKFQPGVSVNPGGKISANNKRLRKALLKILELPADTVFIPTTIIEQIAWSLVERCLHGDGKFKTAVAAIQELANRVDGKAVPSDEELDAQTAPKFIVGTIARPVIKIE